MKQQQCNTSVMHRQGGTQIYCSDTALTTQADTHKQTYIQTEHVHAQTDRHTQVWVFDKIFSLHQIGSAQAIAEPIYL